MLQLRTGLLAWMLEERQAKDLKVQREMATLYQKLEEVQLYLRLILKLILINPH
jgi:Zn-dependent M16 (insulinase) family peptidase